MAKENLQNPILSSLWPLAMLGMIIFFGVLKHASIIAWLVCLAIWTAGAAVEVIQYAKDDETAFPNYVCAAAFLIMGVWMFAS